MGKFSDLDIKMQEKTPLSKAEKKYADKWAPARLAKMRKTGKQDRYPMSWRELAGRPSKPKERKLK